MGERVPGCRSRRSLAEKLAEHLDRVAGVVVPLRLLLRLGSEGDNVAISSHRAALLSLLRAVAHDVAVTSDGAALVLLRAVADDVTVPG